MTASQQDDRPQPTRAGQPDMDAASVVKRSAASGSVKPKNEKVPTDGAMPLVVMLIDDYSGEDTERFVRAFRAEGLVSAAEEVPVESYHVHPPLGVQGEPSKLTFVGRLPLDPIERTELMEHAVRAVWTTMVPLRTQRQHLASWRYWEVARARTAAQREREAA